MSCCPNSPDCTLTAISVCGTLALVDEADLDQGQCFPRRLVITCEKDSTDMNDTNTASLVVDPVTETLTWTIT